MMVRLVSDTFITPSNTSGLNLEPATAGTTAPRSKVNPNDVRSAWRIGVPGSGAVSQIDRHVDRSQRREIIVRV